MKYEGNLVKMKSRLEDGLVYYQLPLGKSIVDVNSLINSELNIVFTGRIHCVHCGNLTKKSYAQGYCYSCFMKLPQTDTGILRPETDRSHLGISRDLEWSKKNSLIPHYVYLSLTDKIKVGVTRHTQVPTRWIDQGAIQAIPIAKTPNRHIAGVIEVFLKSNFADKTHWQQMLTQNTLPTEDLQEEKKRAIHLLHDELKQYVCEDEGITYISYPLINIPNKVTSISFDKIQEFSKRLIGIKGQYLVFEDNTVLNMRNHSGYEIVMEILS